MDGKIFSQDHFFKKSIDYPHRFFFLGTLCYFFKGKFLGQISHFIILHRDHCKLFIAFDGTFYEAEKFQIYRVSKGKDPENAQRAQVYYLLLKLLDTFETAEKRHAIELIKSLELESPEERAAPAIREGVTSSFCNRGSAAVSRFLGFFSRTQAGHDVSIELRQLHA